MSRVRVKITKEHIELAICHYMLDYNVTREYCIGLLKRALKSKNPELRRRAILVLKEIIL